MDEMKKCLKCNKILIVLCIVIILLLIFTQGNSISVRQQWQYRTVTYYGSQYKRQGTQAFNYSEVIVPQDEIDKYGKNGWELVTSYLEMETAFPNFGDKNYVTGININVRPQAVKLIFKRPAKTAGIISLVKQFFN